MTLTVGQIGAGAQVAWHIRAYVDAPQVNRVVLADADEQARERLHQRFGLIKRVHDTPQALLADPEVSVVDICAPVTSRGPLAVAALDAGKHVICAGPPATSLAEFDGMAKAAESAGRRLLVAIPECMLPANQKAGQLLSDGELGRVLLATALLVTSEAGDGRENPDGDGADLHALMYGAIAVMQRWLGPALAVSMSVAGNAGEGSASGEQSAVLNMEMSGGALVQVAATVAGGDAKLTAERRIAGTEAQLLVRDDPEDELPLIGMDRQMCYPVPVHNPPFIMQYATRLMLTDFIECIVDRREPQLTLRETRAALSTLLAADDSNRQARRVSIG